MKIKTIFLGNNYLQLKVLIKKTEVLAVFTRNSREGFAVEETIKLAEQNKIPIYTPTTMRLEKDDSSYKLIKKLNPDLIVSGGYHLVVPGEIIKIPLFGTVNIHPAPLPKYRGQHVIQWQIINNEKNIGTTIHYMAEKLDEGDIISYKECDLDMIDNSLDAWKKTSKLGAELLSELVEKISKGEKIKPYKQDESKAQYFRARKSEDGYINLDTEAINVYNLVRALSFPWPGAILKFEGEERIIEKSEILQTSNLECGEIRKEKNYFLVGTKDYDMQLIIRKHI